MSNFVETPVPVLWVTLTVPTWSSREKLLEDAEKWVRDVGRMSKCHLCGLVGYGTDENPHLHICVYTPESEEERFVSKFHKFQKSRFWRWRSDVQVFKKELENSAKEYVGKHKPEFIAPFCPRIYARCRKGNCEHRFHHI